MTEPAEPISCEHPPRVWPEAEPRVMARAASLFAALGDEGRLRILERLSRGEACVSEIAVGLEEGMSTVSQRLRHLLTEGLVARRREGKHQFYRLADDHVAELVKNAFDHVSHIPER